MILVQGWTEMEETAQDYSIGLVIYKDNLINLIECGNFPWFKDLWENSNFTSMVLNSQLFSSVEEPPKEEELKATQEVSIILAMLEIMFKQNRSS